MVIIELMPGGLASQMQSYAFYRKFKVVYPNVKLDISYFLSIDPGEYKKKGLHNGYELENVFGLNPDYAKIEEVNRFKDDSKRNIDRIRRKIFGKKSTHFVEDCFKIYPNIFETRNKYLSGYWPTPKYFNDIRNILIREFSFKQPSDEKNLNFIKQIENEETVAVHFRRGDFVNNHFHGGICDLNYYKRSIGLISKIVKYPLFIFFSDDPNWVKDQGFDIDHIVVDWNLDGKNARDMHLMSLCKHQILSNSGFGWWAAWLNLNENKIVITPKKWFNDSRYDTSVLIPEEWISI